MVDNFFTCLVNMDGSGLMKLLHPDFTDEDEEGKTSYSEMQVMCGELDDMRRVMERALVPGASLLDVMTAVFAIDGEKLDDETRRMIKEAENTEEGKKVRDESVAAIKEVKKIARQEVTDEQQTLKINSLKINGQNAKLAFTVMVDEKCEYNYWDLTKVDGKWLIKKSRSTSKADAEAE